MNTDNLAEQTEVISDLDQSIKDAMMEVEAESAPPEPEAVAVETLENEDQEIELKKGDKFQDRINKVTADKWEEKRRADALQDELNKLRSQPVTKKLEAEPKLEDFDYDDQAYNSALIDYKVELKAQSLAKAQQDEREQALKSETTRKFMENAALIADKKPDFNEVLAKVPTLQPMVLQAVMEDSKGPELAYYLGTHLDIADKITRMNPIAAAIELGRISGRLSEAKPIKTSSAPEPVEPISSGGSISTSIDEEMPIEMWMKRFNG